MSQERRRFVRVAYTTVVKWGKVASSSKSVSVIPDVSKDISAGGIRLLLSEILKVGDELELEFILPPYRVFNVRGTVRWANTIELISDEGKVTMYYTGVEFSTISDEDKDFINQFVMSLHSTLKR